jgi:uroporphyrin-III C-methyltransferase
MDEDLRHPRRHHEGSRELMPGKVYLMGAGPGDPELMTLKAARALGHADVILVDDLVSRGCLAHARSDAKVIEVGKRAGEVSTPQEYIHKLAIQLARTGKVVARLKGGDPFIFGRGGEELAALVAAGIDVEVIPGVTAGIAVPATLGIPVTHRDLAHGVTFVTGHGKDGAEPDWRALAACGTTLVIYMGLKKLPGILIALLEAGMDPKTPACIIENGTLANQRQVVATLDSLSGAGMNGPSIIVIGQVVLFAASLSQTEARAA